MNDFVDKYRELLELIKKAGELNKEIAREGTDFLLSFIPAYSSVQNVIAGSRLCAKLVNRLEIENLKRSIEL